jgi:tungstate transport system permease protein
MHSLWLELRSAVPLIFHGNAQLLSILWFTLEVAAIATAIASVIGIPLGAAIALGRFRGRGLLQLLANMSLALPPALLGAVLYLVFARQGPLGSLQLLFTRRAVFIAQSLLALPYTTAFTIAAIRALPSGLLDQARRFGARRIPVSVLALREARIGVSAAVIAALGTSLSEVAAITMIGGNVYGYNQTLASATLYEVNGAGYADALAIAIVLMFLIVLLLGGLTLLLQQTDTPFLRFRAST